MTDDQVKEAILDRTKESDGRVCLTCGDAHIVADKLGVSLALVGRICELQKIKITSCMLGCFGGKHE